MIVRLAFWVIGLLGLGFGGLWLNWQMSTASHERNWQALYARLPTVQKADGLYQLENVRNWSYSAEGGAIPEWVAVDLDPDNLARLWFIEEPFGDVRAVAHTMLAFEFADGSGYIASIEARREDGEAYGGFKAGVLPMHEYMVVWTTERDMYGNSTYYTGDQLYLFPLDIPKEVARAVLEGMMTLTDELETTPRWYNTFFSNCTNVLARTVNHMMEGAAPWNVAWYLPGYAAEFLYDQGFIAGEGTFEEIRAQSFLTPRVATAYGITDPVSFSRAVRE